MLASRRPHTNDHSITAPRRRNPFGRAARSLVCALAFGLAACGAADEDSAGAEGHGEPSSGSETGAGAAGDDAEAAGQSDEGTEASSEIGEGGGALADAPVNPDSISSTPSEATFTTCAPRCAECDAGLRVDIRRRRGWSAAEYGFEILSEGNHIRCRATLPCDDAAPVRCSSSPGGPVVSIETEGCGGPPSAQRLVALRFEGACPEEIRVEGFRNGVGTGNDVIRPRYATGPECDGTCQTAAGTMTMVR